MKVYFHFLIGKTSQVLVQSSIFPTFKIVRQTLAFNDHVQSFQYGTNF